MRKICARHELRMLGLTVSTLLGAPDHGLHSAEHAEVLAEVEACPRCRRRRGAEDAPAAQVIVTFSCPEEVDPAELAATVEDALPEYVDHVTVRVA
ncbi:hypothetical protein [Nocardioides sp. T2.26MG-1]|uniref:hypothetical protein n=1 Tax=Nocardioides sp. T2.26MG-1 TaxID=3041166 RepID=UPI00247733EF|nr:hypothetical protein [Nocardioides sp. T2.26MG-1]CAI9413418.1 hypothetical protein HIDPHFAB_02015 [Nocardioides sp. T2.26MG-1]